MLPDLLKLLPAPLKPTHADGDWGGVESELGLQLPSDYKQVIQTYGYGEFCDDLSLINPFVGKSYSSNANAIIQQWQQIAELCSVEYPFFPEKGGLLPCAVNVNGHYISWRTDGDPNDWDIVIWDSSEPSYVTSNDKPFVDLLYALLAGSSPQANLLLPDLTGRPNRRPWFTQWQIDPATGTVNPVAAK